MYHKDKLSDNYDAAPVSKTNNGNFSSFTGQMCLYVELVFEPAYPAVCLHPNPIQEKPKVQTS